MHIAVFTDITDRLATLIKDDPVRPEIPLEQRVNQHSRIYVLEDDQGETLAVTCVKFLADIPASVEDLANVVINTNTAVFYTIWSYAAGAGRQLIEGVQQELKTTQPEISTFVTLSPKTEMARRFHHKNGASTYRENADSINYLYN